MKRLFVIIIIAAVIIACNKKAMPVITERTTDPPPPESPVANVKPDLVIGQRVFTNQCGKCHDLPDPAKYNAERWEGILRTMIPRAGISRVNEVHVTAYIGANSKQ
jgi:cytochrome c5